METKKISTEQVKPNDYNPNGMTPTTFGHLMQTIDLMGFLQNILVWKKSENDYVIIDGEHRWKALREQGVSQIEAKILTDDDLRSIGKKLQEKGLMNEEESLESIAKALTILMNEIKGSDDPVKLAAVINTITPYFGSDGIITLLNKSKEELEGLNLLLNWSDQDIEKLMNELDEQRTYAINIQLNNDEYAEYAAAKGKKNDKEFIMEMVRNGTG